MKWGKFEIESETLIRVLAIVGITFIIVLGMILAS